MGGTQFFIYHTLKMRNKVCRRGKEEEECRGAQGEERRSAKKRRSGNLLLEKEHRGVMRGEMGGKKNEQKGREEKPRTGNRERMITHEAAWRVSVRVERGKDGKTFGDGTV